MSTGCLTTTNLLKQKSNSLLWTERCCDACQENPPIYGFMSGDRRLAGQEERNLRWTVGVHKQQQYINWPIRCCLDR